MRYEERGQGYRDVEKLGKHCSTASKNVSPVSIQIKLYFPGGHIGHILRRTCILQRVIEGKIKGGIEVTGRQGRRRRKLLDDQGKARILSIEGGSSRSRYVTSWL